ncbi:hypothetical protein B0I32_123213, partial [Nonomuraea fuscirosea]
IFAPSARFVNLNITGFDAAKLSGLQLVADARVVVGMAAQRGGEW